MEEPGARAASGCAAISLAETLATARAGGASVVVARGALSGPGRADANGGIYDPMTLTSVRTLNGPEIHDGATVWVSGSRGPRGPIPGADAGALWAPDGQLFGLVWPAGDVVSLGPYLRVAPLVADQVILSVAGCWQTIDLTTTAFTGELAEIPGSDSYARAARGGFHAVTLTTVEELVAR